MKMESLLILEIRIYVCAQARTSLEMDETLHQDISIERTFLFDKKLGFQLVKQAVKLMTFEKTPFFAILKTLLFLLHSTTIIIGKKITQSGPNRE